MREKRRDPNDGSGFGYVPIPEELLNDLDDVSEEALRVLLYLNLAEFRAGVVGVPVPFGEIAEHCGLSAKRTARGLIAAQKLDEVERVPGTDCWRLLPPPFTES